jgi:3-hydroxyisobutyrate dehydrogenase/glyoxylate/succinic semialdehyde reductase
MKIGFIGLGIMGSRMAENLAKAGFDMTVYNRTKQKAESLITYKNVEWRETPALLAKDADILFTMLSSPEVVYALANGDEGFLKYLRPGSVWVDCSTVNPSFSREMAILSKEYEISFIDAPVAGSLAPAKKGELIFLAGGDKEAIEGLNPYLEAMGKKTIHVGENGKGTSLKMVFNLLLGQAMYAFSEGLNLGESLGIDRELLFNVLLKSPVVAPFITGKKTKIDKEDYSAEFPLQWMQKDLQLASQTAYEQEIPLPGVNVIKEIYALAKKDGYAEKDFSAIYQYLNEKH